MKVESNYPHLPKQKLQRAQVISWAKWPFLYAAVGCVIVNLCVGGKAWSAIAVWGLWTAWALGFSPDMVEYNRISQLIKVIIFSSVMMILIDRLLSPGWAISAVPIVCFGGLIASAVLFLTDFERQKQNMMPMVMLTLLSLLSSIIGIAVLQQNVRWEFLAMGGISLAMLVLAFCLLGGDMARNIRKHFHTR